MKAPITTYIVEVFDSPHWKTVLTTKDKKVALEALKPLGKHGRITHSEAEMTEPGWRQTSEDDENDYIFCRPGGEMIGRVYLDNRVRHEDGYHWRWFYSSQTGHTS